MSYKLIFDPKALRELSDSWNWYEQRQTGLGNEFEKEVYNRIKYIEQDPERYPQKRKSYREIKIKKYPFLIVYKFYRKGKTVLIVSIFHTSRNPKHKYAG